MEQLAHKHIQNAQQKFPIIVLGDELRTPQNIGMCIRVCEAFGVRQFYQNDQSPDISNRIVQRTARNTDKQLPVTIYNDLLTTLGTLKKEGFTLIALEITDSSKNIHDYKFHNHEKIALLIGSERFGITPKALSMCDVSIHIPMFGNNSSMNVVNSLSVSLYEMTKQLNNIKDELNKQ